MPETLPLIATTAFGLEGITKRELAALGYSAEILSSHTDIITPVALDANEGDWGELLRCLART
jgi:hypothetical protein